MMHRSGSHTYIGCLLLLAALICLPACGTSVRTIDGDGDVDGDVDGDADGDVDGDADGDADGDVDGDGDGDCDDGYEPLGDECVDIDECVIGTHNCHPDARCTNEEGGFDCECLEGFGGNGIACEDINECAAGTDDCDANARCENTHGDFSCTCNDGFAGDGLECTDINECAAGLDDCHHDASCHNDPGSFSCACNPGYEGDGATCVAADAMGHAVLVGHDYYLSNTDQDRLVGNALFLAPLATTVRVLAYTEFADTATGCAGGGCEVERTDAAIDMRASELGRTWSRTELRSYRNLETALPGYDALLIYAQDRVGAEMVTVADAWASSVANFVHDGGVLVVCGGEGWRILQAAGLMDIESAATVRPDEVLSIDARADAMATGAAGSYLATTTTNWYETSEPGTVVSDSSGRPVVIHATFERGGADLYALPYDFHTFDDAAADLLYRAVTYGFYSEPVVGAVSDCMDRVSETDPTNPGAPAGGYLGEFYAMVGALLHGGLPPANLTIIASAAEARAHAGDYDVLLFGERETCVPAAAPWAPIVDDLITAGGRVVVTYGDRNADFISDLGMFGSGTVATPDPPFTAVADPFWDGITHPDVLRSTSGWSWTGPGLTPLGHSSTDPTRYTVFGYMTD